MELGARFKLLKQLWAFTTPGGLLRMRFPLPTALSKLAWQTCPIASTVAVVWKKQLCIPSTTASRIACFGVTSKSGWPALIPNSLYCSVLVTSWTMFDPPYWGEKHVVFIPILAVARIGIWEMRKKGLYDSANFFRDLIFFRHHLRVDS